MFDVFFVWRDYWYFLNGISGKITFISIFILLLLIGWLTAMLSCKDLREIFLEKLEWKNILLVSVGVPVFNGEKELADIPLHLLIRIILDLR